MAGLALIGGGSGFIGRYVQKALTKRGYDVMLVGQSAGLNKLSWDQLKRDGLPADCEVVVNLAGKPAFGPFRRWTPQFKEAVWNSRVDTTKLLRDLIKEAAKKPKVFVSSSAVGFYEPSETEKYKESSPPGTNFLSDLCVEWEKAAQLPPGSETRVVTVRWGQVLERSGGLIYSLYPAFYLHMGGRLGSGTQWFSWIHADDAGELVAHAVDGPSNECVLVSDSSPVRQGLPSPSTGELQASRDTFPKDLDKDSPPHPLLSGPVNATAPAPVRYSEFVNAFAAALRRQTGFPIPDFVLNLLMGREQAWHATRGCHAYPQRALLSGFKFTYTNIESACGACTRFSP